MERSWHFFRVETRRLAICPEALGADDTFANRPGLFSQAVRHLSSVTPQMAAGRLESTMWLVDVCKQPPTALNLYCDTNFSSSETPPFHKHHPPQSPPLLSPSTSTLPSSYPRTVRSLQLEPGRPCLPLSFPSPSLALERDIFSFSLISFSFSLINAFSSITLRARRSRQSSE